jgi:hypothetical protein
MVSVDVMDLALSQKSPLKWGNSWSDPRAEKRPCPPQYEGMRILQSAKYNYRPVGLPLSS